MEFPNEISLADIKLPVSPFPRRGVSESVAMRSDEVGRWATFTVDVSAETEPGFDEIIRVTVARESSESAESWGRNDRETLVMRRDEVGAFVAALTAAVGHAHAAGVLA